MYRRNFGFTLIEVLIVVVIMAVLAATIIPQFTASTDDAKKSARDFNAHSLRAQIELYRIDHGKYPASADVLAAKLTHPTNAAEAEGTTPGEDYPYGPYIMSDNHKLPKNPMNNYDAVVAGTGADAVEGNYGWQYNATTGEIWPNDSDYWTERAAE